MPSKYNDDEEQNFSFIYNKLIIIGVVLFVLILPMCFSSAMFESVDADKNIVIQSLSGDLVWHTSPGWVWQGFGKVTEYKKRSLYDINIPKVRFNDGAHGTLNGSIQYELPTDHESLTALHIRFGSQEAIQNQLIKTIVDKSVYMTGPLMSSKESYAERRNSLISYIEDQVENGVYRTKQRDERQRDPITGFEKTVTVVEIVIDEHGNPARQEEAVLAQFGIKPFNFSISGLDYEPQVEQQIQAQQQATMDVQTAMAVSKKAEQEALTVAKKGEAEAARTKWEQEAIKAREVTKAQQEKEVAMLNASRELEVAKLEADAAEQYRIKRYREADADSTYKRKVMEADGALAQKLEAYIEVSKYWSDAFANRRVPTTVMGSSNHDTDVSGFMDILTAKAARELSIDFKMGVDNGK